MKDEPANATSDRPAVTMDFREARTAVEIKAQSYGPDPNFDPVVSRWNEVVT